MSDSEATSCQNGESSEEEPIELGRGQKIKQKVSLGPNDTSKQSGGKGDSLDHSDTKRKRAQREA